MKNNVKSTIKLAIFTTTILYHASSLSAEYIKKITIQNNERVEASTIINYLKLHVGEEYTLAKEDAALKSLYSTSLFENINIKFLNNGNLVVKVTETPFITKVILQGNSKIKTAQLSKELLTMAGDSVSHSKIQLDVKKIKEIYKRSGRFSTIVVPKIETLQNSRVKVIFDITEGPKTTIRQIYFNGNNNYSDNELQSIIMTKRTRWFSFFETNDTYDPDRLEYDKELLKEFYQSVGFADFRVISATAELGTTKEYFSITYSVEEGQKYKIGHISIDNKLLDTEVTALQKYITVKPGSIFNIKTLNQIADKMSLYFAVSGYPGVNIYPDVSSRNPDHTIDIKFVIEKADKAFINQININNNLKTEDKVIRREFKIAEGDIFNRSYIENGEKNLRNLDYFEQVLVNLTPTDKKDKYDLNIEVEEKSTSSIGFDIGYNTAGGLFGRLSFLERNLIGTGKILNAGVQTGKKSISYYGGITEPHFLDKDLSLGINVFKNHVGRGTSFLSQGDQNYTLKSVGLKTSLGYEIAEDLSHEIEYTIKKEELKSPTESNSIFLKEQMGKFTTSAIGHTITYEQLDSRIIPKNGYIISGTQEFAGVGGNNKYLKHELDGKYFKSFVNNKVTLKLAASIGNIKGIGSKNVRISDRFNLGDYSLRGFSSGGVGPREKKTSEELGGEKFYTFSTELNFPTGLPEEFNLTGAVFMDVGSLWGVGRKTKTYPPDSFYNDKSLRASVGAGFIWITRLAPIRMDWAFPIKKKPYDDKQTFHIKFSTHF
ncbi:outer membrane protein assembly factor BamA [Candidatus Tisiphia endosymbiont of Nemotelus uliginosus]|uniref:outer membrane protein assembly factor BamA n=1 Tax=Candidatus Tisiphia endosymbiont of Nemotelus uliginosus TaxID=3077926 RepID=UPI0035C8D38F